MICLDILCPLAYIPHIPLWISSMMRQTSDTSTDLAGLDIFLSCIVFHHPRGNLLLIFSRFSCHSRTHASNIIDFCVSLNVIISWLSISFIFNLSTVGRGFFQSHLDRLNLIFSFCTVFHHPKGNLLLIFSRFLSFSYACSKN